MEFILLCFWTLGPFFFFFGRYPRDVGRSLFNLNNSRRERVSLQLFLNIYKLPLDDDLEITSPHLDRLNGMFRIPFFLYTGLKHFTKNGYESASKHFDQTTTSRDLGGCHAIVTGANQGIGFQVALELAQRNANVHMVCRNQERGTAALEQIREQIGSSTDSPMESTLYLHIADISSLASIRKFVDEYSSAGFPLHFLINNAGLMVHDHQRSVDDYEMNFACNTLGTYYLTKLLGPVLARTSTSAQNQTTTGPTPRVITVSSGGALTEALVIDDVQGEKIKHKKDFGTIQYARDKRRQLAMTEQLAREWSGTDGSTTRRTDRVQVVAMHPGWTTTDGVKTSIPGFYESFKDKFRSLQQGADTIVYLCCCNDQALKTGEWYLDRSVQPKHLPLGGTKYSEEKAKELLHVLDKMIDDPSSTL